jgi:hypothetical protein
VRGLILGDGYHARLGGSGRALFGRQRAICGSLDPLCRTVDLGLKRHRFLRCRFRSFKQGDYRVQCALLDRLTLRVAQCAQIG